MGSVTQARTVSLTAVLVAAGIVLVARDRQPPGAPAPAASPASSAAAEIAARASSAPAGDAVDAGTARLRELEQMSETFRNTTFLMAIRESGFVCNELLQVYGGVNDSLTWTTSCSEMLAYTVRVTNDGGLGIEPVLGHIDGLPFAPIREPGSEGVRPPLPPIPLPR